MRLLKIQDDGSLAFTADLIKDVPQYAILSHTWGQADAEVTFDDMSKCTGQHKIGYEKIDFCRNQSIRDGLNYFWVDTCCIDKSNNTELSEAINSMFCWYQNASKCYVYLSDVPKSSAVHVNQGIQSVWEEDFRASRWFTRGWTLQELIAPARIDFFSKKGVCLGNKSSLTQLISEITGVPAPVIRGSPLSHCTVSERMAWAERRETTRLEDKAYSLLGIFDVQMPLLYGEGQEKALKRLREYVNKALKGSHYQDFSVTFSLHGAPEINHFVARKQELSEIHEALSSDGSRRVVVLHGLGGIGKTQLAIAYAKRHKDNYSAIFWLNIKDENSVNQSFVRIAKQILRQYPSAICVDSENVERNIDKTIEAVKSWLSLPANTRWLLVYDNYDNPKLSDTADPKAVDILQYLPEAYQGSVVITTRSSRVEIGRLIRMKKIGNVYDSLEILLTTSDRKRSIDDPDAAILAEELDGLPLALATAGAYLKHMSISFESYLRLYKSSWAKLQNTTPKLGSYDDRTLYSTWQLSFDQVKQQNEYSAAFLRLWAYFDNEDIWFELFQLKHKHNLTWVREVTKDELSFNDMIRTLSDYGLVEAHPAVEGLPESRGYSVHSCVHSWMTHVLNQEWENDLAKFAVMCIASHVLKEQSAQWWITQRRLLPHAAKYSCDSLDEILDNGTTWVFRKLGDLYFGQAKLKEAEELQQRALRISEGTLGPNHLILLCQIHKLAIVYKSQGRLDEAERMLQRLLQVAEDKLESDHERTLFVAKTLATLYRDKGKLTEAENMAQQAFRGRKADLGPDHISTLEAARDLGCVYRLQGKFGDAENMYLAALQGTVKALGPDHTLTLVIVNLLAVLYSKQGKLKEGENMYQWALRGLEAAFGPDHELTLKVVGNLGMIYAKGGKLEEAEQKYQRALRGFEVALRPNHELTLRVADNLGILYANREKLEEAGEMWQRALRGYEVNFGRDHTSTLQVVCDLGMLYVKEGRLEEAEEMYQRALDAFEKGFGESDHNTQTILANMRSIRALRASMGGQTQTVVDAVI